MEDLSQDIRVNNDKIDSISDALRGIIKNELYRSFKGNRELEAWTDDESRVQTNLHDLYNRLGGNGEETIWWTKKQNWKIVSQEEYDRMYLKFIEENC